MTKHHFSSEESLLESVVNGRNVQQSQEIRPATCDEGVDDLEANTASSEPQLPVGDHSVAAHEVYSQTSNVQSVTRRNFSVIEIVDLPSTNKCAICLEPYHIGDTVTWSSNSCCSHYFHQGCIADWIMQQWIKRQHLFNSIRSDAAKNEEFMESVGCPCCRQKFIAMKNEAIEVIDESDGDCEQMSTASAGSNGLVLYPTRSDIGSSSTIHNGANNNDEA